MPRIDPRSATAQLPELADALAVTGSWVDDLAHQLGWHEQDTAFRSMVACLHALRDALPKEEAVHLGLALPVLLRGFYFEGWRPSARSLAARKRSAFLERIYDGVDRDPAIDAEQVARAVMAMLSKRLPAAELENAKAATPHELHGLWRD